MASDFEISHLDAEIKKLEARNNPAQQPRLRELKRELKKRELAAGASLPGASGRKARDAEGFSFYPRKNRGSNGARRDIILGFRRALSPG